MRIVQALYWLRDLFVREGESDQVKPKLAKLFEDPKTGPSLKADLTTGMTALPTWMWEFLKPLIETDPAFVVGTSTMIVMVQKIIIIIGRERER